METRNSNFAPTTSFKDLSVWQEGHEYVLLIYNLSQQFPDDERFGLTSQVRRAAVSITSNIAEGYRRKSGNDKEYFYVMARGSIDEVANQLQIAHDLGYISADDFATSEKQREKVAKLLNGLLRAHRNFR